MSTPDPAADTARDAAQLEQLLARYIGPMARIMLARARKTAQDDDELVASLAQSIDSESERSAFLAAARKFLAARKDTSMRIASPAPAAAPATSVSQAARAEAVEKAPTAEKPASASTAMKPGAIFVSYARDNLAIAQRVVEALREVGLDVWLDLGELQPGDSWDLKIKRNIEACSYFVPLISRETDARQEGYFRREWNLAADRALNFADDVPFILPVTIDDTAAYMARVPERFRQAHWMSMPTGEVTPEFVSALKELVVYYRNRTRG